MILQCPEREGYDVSAGIPSLAVEGDSCVSTYGKEMPVEIINDIAEEYAEQAFFIEASISAYEPEGGNTLEETLAFAKMAEGYLDVSYSYFPQRLLLASCFFFYCRKKKYLINFKKFVGSEIAL
jgi:hypothetical protein